MKRSLEHRLIEARARYPTRAETGRWGMDFQQGRRDRVGRQVEEARERVATGGG